MIFFLFLFSFLVVMQLHRPSNVQLVVTRFYRSLSHLLELKFD